MNGVVIEKSLEEHPELSPILDVIIFQRNMKMAEKIKGYLSTDDTYFVVVGAAHLVGGKGIVSLLEKAGYPVRKF